MATRATTQEPKRPTVYTEAMEVFTVEGVRLLFHAECHDMWIALRERSSRGS